MNSILTFLAGFGMGTVLFPLGFWFWLFLAADLIWMSWLVSDGDTRYNYDRPATGLATFVLILTAVILQFFTRIKIITLILANPAAALLVFASYVTVGVVWSFIKWTTYLLDWREQNKDSLKRADERITSYEKSLQETTTALLKNEIEYKIRSEKESLQNSVPTANKQKQRIITWTAYWPWSVLWTCVTDYLRRFFQRLYQLLESSYNTVQRRILSDFYKE